ncbi:MAG TPA: helix-turn-helix domain-containing protein [Terriglobales bacterium]|jgi:HTH-type transcriptional regulator/antitoxin HipB|nr:helix-turn-helix domain-containing protein [Terriglobales bacterium]
MDHIARTPKQIGAILQRRRRTLKLTQNQLRSRVKLRQATVSKLEAGEPGTRLDTVFGLLGALGLELVVRPRTSSSAQDIEDIF